MTQNEVEIEYCVACGLLPAAEETGHALLSTYGRRIASLRYTPGQGGVFRVSVDMRRVFDKTDKTDEGFDLDAIVARVGESMAPSPC